MFENLKKKLSGFFSKTGETVAAAPVGEEKEPLLPPISELKEEIVKEHVPTAEEKAEELAKEPGKIPEDEIEIVTVDEKLPTAEEKAEELIKEPEKPAEEDIEIVTVEAEQASGIGRQESAEEPQADIDVIKVPEKAGEVVEEFKEEIEEIEEKPGFFKLFSKITHKELTEKDIAPILWELEIALLENDVAKEVSEKITSHIKETLLSKKAKRGTVQEIVKSSLKKSVNSILSKETVDLFKLAQAKKEKPFVIAFIGFNGTGKTLTIAKFAKLFKDNNFSVVLAAGDTFRAAAIEQLEEHAAKLKLPVIKQKKGADSAAVIFDSIKHAKAKKVDVVLADTAGRSHTNTNLMDELKKICRVNKPDFKIFVGDSLTGNDAAEQAKLFNDAVGIDASVLTKIDTDAKGGACLSVAYVTGKPILYLGTGQDYGDMAEFSSKWFMDKVF